MATKDRNREGQEHRRVKAHYVKRLSKHKKVFYFIVMEQFFFVQKNVFKNNIHTKLDFNEEIVNHSVT